MKPITFTQKGGITNIHYPFSTLREFITYGNEEGTTGVILTQRIHAPYQASVFASYGTLQHPNKKRYTITMVHCEPFDGIWISDEKYVERINTPAPQRDFKMIIIDLSS